MKNIKISNVTSYFRRSVSVRYICEAQTRLNISLFQRALDQSHQPQLMDWCIAKLGVFNPFQGYTSHVQPYCQIFISFFSWTSSERERYLCKILLKGLFRGRFEVVFRMFGVPFRSPSTTLSVTPGNEHKKAALFSFRTCECNWHKNDSFAKSPQSSAVFNHHVTHKWLQFWKKKSGGDC